MKIKITSYDSLLLVARQQPEPQRLLFVFLKASLPKDYEGDEAIQFQSGQGGESYDQSCVLTKYLMS